MLHPLTTELVQAFARDGAVVLRGVLSSVQVKRLEEGIEHNLAHPSPLCIVASEPDDPGRFVEDFCTWQDNPAYREILTDSALPHVAAQLMGSETARCTTTICWSRRPVRASPRPGTRTSLITT
jgi:hypothetical protein